jgi:alpha-ketoglutarate-dependent taurine dioxygenase
LRPGESFPLLLEPVVPGVDLVEWAAANPARIDDMLLQHKAVLFRGFPVRDVAEFERFAKACTRTLLSYTNRSTPRSQVSGDVYTSTEFPADQSIPMHNEMSYTRSWPMKLWFHCVTPSATGGETPFADSALVFERLSPETRRAFADRGVMYVRNFGGGVDLSWQDVFQTSDRTVVDAYCRDNDIELEWRSGDRLRTRQRCQGVARHPVTGETTFMNQAHLFNVHSLMPAVRDAMLSAFGKDELPRNSYFGDGSEIPVETLDEITRVYDETAIAFPWQAGDVVMLDNMRVAHGRRPFTGARKIVVAMAEAYSPPDGEKQA